MKFILFLILIGSAIAQDRASDASICAERWKHVHARLGEASKARSKGENLAMSNHDGAWKLFNEARSIATTYKSHFMTIYESCKNHIAITKKMARDAEELMQQIEDRCQCGMELTSALQSYKKMFKKIDHYKEILHDNTSVAGVRTVLIPKATRISIDASAVKKSFEVVSNHSISCDNQDDMIEISEDHGDHVKGVKASFDDELERMREFLKQQKD